MRKRNKYEVVEVFVGKMKPLNQGTYKRSFCKREDKPLTKIYKEPREQNPFIWYKH